ncbi:hypothetical protein EV702DRAFT_1096260, partial [Suillus placidus]
MAVITYKTQIFGACAILGSVDWLYLFWNLLRGLPLSLLTLHYRVSISMMGLAFVLVLLAGYKSLQHYFQVPDKTWSSARLMRAFARDSIIYFLW